MWIEIQRVSVRLYSKSDTGNTFVRERRFEHKTEAFPCGLEQKLGIFAIKLKVGAQSFWDAPNEVAVVDWSKNFVFKGLGENDGAFSGATWADALLATKGD